MKTIKIAQAIIGWMITYFDGFSGSQTRFTIKTAEWDEEREGYHIRGSRERDYLFINIELMKKMIVQDEITINRSIDGCPFRETYKIRSTDESAYKINKG